MLKYEIKFALEIIKNKCILNFFDTVKNYYKWKRSNTENYSPMNERKPWLTLEAISIIDRQINQGDKVFEYGGGGSTLYFIDKGANVVTVEHDEDWFNLIQKKISNNKNWDGILEKPQFSSAINNPSNPDLYISMDENYNGRCFRNYASSIDRYPDSFFDFVVIDGRSRPSCIKHSFCKVKPGGYLLLDNTERNYYLSEKTINYFKFYICVSDKFSPTLGSIEFTKTTIWKRIT
jgi:hypothetical protein